MLMAEAVSSSLINDLLIQISRSLLQYVSEIWPWSAADAEETRRTLDRLAAEQRDSAAALVRFLDGRREVIDFGTYPTEYTSLHYVAVDFLLGQLVENQSSVVAGCEAALRSAEADVDATDLLRDVTTAERNRLDELRRLSVGG